MDAYGYIYVLVIPMLCFVIDSFCLWLFATNSRGVALSLVDLFL